MKTRLNPTREFLLVVALATTYSLWITWPMLSVLSDSCRLASALHPEACTRPALVINAVRQRSLDLRHFSIYGHLYYNTALVPLFLLSYLKPVSEQEIIVFMRLLQVFFTVGTFSVTFLLARRYFGRLAGWLSVVFLSVSRLSPAYSVLSPNPDYVQVFFVLLAVYFCCRLVEEARWRWLMLASGAAGFAHSTKYAGMFLLPVILFIVVFQSMVLSKSVSARADAARFAGFLRAVSAFVGLICLFFGFVSTPEFAVRYLASDGILDDVYDMQLLLIGRVSMVFAGCVLALLSIPGFLWSMLGRMPRFFNAVKKTIVVVVVFFLAFLFTSPYLFAGLRFIKILYSQYASTLATGLLFKARDSQLTWFLVLSEVSGRLMLLLAVVGMVLTVLKIFRGWREKHLTPESAVLMWVILYMGVLILLVKYCPPRYILPVLPFLVVFSASAVSEIIGYVKTKLPEKYGLISSAAILLVITVTVLLPSFNGMLEYRQLMIRLEDTSIPLKAGRWLAEHYPPSTRIMYDAYAYVPESFTDANWSWGFKIKELEKLKPDVVLTHNRTSGKYSNIHDAKRFTRGVKAFMERYEYYNGLSEGRLNYTLVRDFREVKIYAKN
jgi:hypothetical protein